MNLLRLCLSVVVACGATTVLTGPLMAFEQESGAVTVPGGTTQFGDPDETPLPAPLASPQLGEDGTSLQMAPGTSLQMSPIGQTSGNPADNKSLIPGP